MEETHKYFEVDEGYQSPFMTFSPKARQGMKDRLGDIIHQDGTCRIQTLMKGQNLKFHSLLTEFFKVSGLPILLNTSLNIMGQPILESIQDAALFFKDSKIQTMIFGDYLITKKISNQAP